MTSARTATTRKVCHDALGAWEGCRNPVVCSQLAAALTWASRADAADALRRLHVVKEVVRRRRCAAAAVAGRCASNKGHPGGPNREEIAFSWERHLMRLSAAEFRLRYRLTAPAFCELLDILRPSLSKNGKRGYKRRI